MKILEPKSLGFESLRPMKFKFERLTGEKFIPSFFMTLNFCKSNKIKKMIDIISSGVIILI